MTTQEMHIALDLGIQKINSQYNKYITPHEKDWFLNNEVNKFIKQRMNPQSNPKQTGFQDTSKRINDLKDLIKTESLEVKQNNRGISYVTFPSNYLYYIRFDSFCTLSCNSLNIKSINKPLYKIELDLNFPSTDTISTYKIDVNYNNSIINIFDIDNLPSDYINKNEFYKQHFQLIKALKIKLENNLKKQISSNSFIYWEIESYNYLDNKIIIYTDKDISINLNNGEEFNTNSVLINIKDNGIFNMLKGSIRVSDEEFLTDLEISTLSKSTPYSPLGVIKMGVLELSKLESAIYKTINITYICKPNLIDIHLNSNLNLNRSSCEEIVDNTIRFIKNIINDNNYEQYKQENILIE